VELGLTGISIHDGLKVSNKIAVQGQAPFAQAQNRVGRAIFTWFLAMSESFGSAKCLDGLQNTNPARNLGR
jgi:hypothetical protein